MNRIFKLLFYSTVLVCVCFVLLSCGSSTNSHTHTFGEFEVVKEATCTENGKKKKSCIECGFLIEEVIYAEGHQYNTGVETKAPTCTETGGIKYTCIVCGEFYTKTINAKGHTLISIGKVVEPTCQQTGITDGKQCKDCGLIVSEQTMLNKVDHNYEKGLCIWCKEEKIFSISFAVNDKIIKNDTFTVSSKNVEEPVIPIKPGYDSKWEDYTLGYNDVIVNAIYTPKKYSITYNNCLDHSNPETYTIESEITLVKSIKAGYKFVGWYDSENNLITSIKKGTQGNLTLTAKWELESYSITIEGVQNIDSISIPDTYTIESETIVLPPLNVVGYTFICWKKNNNEVTEIPKGSTGNVILNAVMTPNQYHLTLEPNEGTLENKDIQITHSDSVVLPVPNYKGKTFVGWYDSENMQMTDGGGKCLVSAELLKDKTLFAHYEVLKCEVKFETDGGTKIDAVQYDYGSKLGDVTIPTKEGVYFAGWYSLDGEVQYTNETVVQENLILYAKWIISKAVSTADELIAIADHPEENYHLVNDINLDGNVWKPIDNFSGILEGNGYTIKNFNLSSTQKEDNFALFRVNNGTIKNINFSNFTFNFTYSQNCKSSENMNLAVLVGNNKKNIENCHLTQGNIVLNCSYYGSGTGSYSTFGGDKNILFGQIAGYNQGYVHNCSSNVAINAKIIGQTFDSGGKESSLEYYLGGLIGRNNNLTFNSSYNSTICINVKNISYMAGGWNEFGYLTNWIMLGGIISSNNGTCYNCYGNTTFQIESQSQPLSQNKVRIGAFVGQNISSGIIKQCYATGTITGGSSDDNILGGFVGLNSSGGQIESCYSDINIQTQNGGEVGGFVGNNQAVIQNCYSSSIVQNFTTTGNIGGFAGKNDTSGTITKCYSTGDVSSVGGNTAHFVGLNAGALFKCYFMQGASLVISGVYENRVIEYETIEGILYSKLWSEEFLVDELFWNSEGWIILTDENPLLEWEITIGHNFETMVVKPTCEYGGFTVYNCSDCNRLFIKDFIEPIGHDYVDAEVVDPTCEVEGYTLQKCSHEGCNSTTKVNIVAATGHNPDSTTLKNEKPATCTENGLAVYHCNDCGNDFSKELVATGHSGIYQKTVTEPTCTEYGEDEYYCSICEKNYTISVDMLEHTWIDVVGRNATCGIVRDAEGNIIERHPIDGNRPGVKCSVCESIQYGCEVIPAHQFSLAETLLEPTCSTNGRGNYQCSLCEFKQEDEILQLGHNDANRDNICDVCSELSFTLVSKELFVHITDIEGLKNIKNNPSGYYWLDADIDLSNENWIALGTEKLPFKGIFYGNGHTISGIKYKFDNSKETLVLGLFGYNYGSIVNVKVSNYTVDVTNSNLLFGGIAAFNRGQILNCTLEGKNTFNFIISKTITSNNQEIALEYEYISGGIVGTNDQTGSVENCSVNGSITSKFENHSAIAIEEISTIWQLIGQYMIQYIYKTKVSTIQHISFGGIVGKNEGSLETCTVTASIESLSTAKADLIDRLKGEAFAYTHLYAGALAGYNSGKVTNCSSTSMKYNIPDGYKNVNIPYLLTGKSYSTGYEIINYAKYASGIDGVVGSNSSFGQIENYNPIA